MAAGDRVGHRNAQRNRRDANAAEKTLDCLFSAIIASLRLNERSLISSPEGIFYLTRSDFGAHGLNLADTSTVPILPGSSTQSFAKCFHDLPFTVTEAIECSLGLRKRSRISLGGLRT